MDSGLELRVACVQEKNSIVRFSQIVSLWTELRFLSGDLFREIAMSRTIFCTARVNVLDQKH